MRYGGRRRRMLCGVVCAGDGFGVVDAGVETASAATRMAATMPMRPSEWGTRVRRAWERKRARQTTVEKMGKDFSTSVGIETLRVRRIIDGNNKLWSPLVAAPSKGPLSVAVEMCVGAGRGEMAIVMIKKKTMRRWKMRLMEQLD
ncbi:hypothetical protein AHAS_AhasUnG0034100 [Arachis hypogaea]